MKDLSIEEFCDKHNACSDGQEWASHQALAKYRVQTNGKTNLWRKP